MLRYILLLVVVLVSAVGYGMKPSATYVAVPDTLKLPYEKNVVTTPDGYKLKSWTFLPTKEADNKTTLVLAYADAGNMSWWLTYASVLSQSGFTVVMFDYRGFGESDAFAVNQKMLYYDEFATDLSAVLQFAKGKYAGNKIGVLAYSMGTIVATLAAKNTPPDFIVGEGYITDPAAVKAYYAAKSDEVLLPPGAATYAAALGALRLPMLIFSGSKDEVAPAKAVYGLKKANRKVTVVDFDGGHMQGFWKLTRGYTGSEYVADMRRFLGMKA